MKETLLRPLLLSALVVSMLAPAVTAMAQKRHYQEGYYITVNPNLRRVWHHHRWVYRHHRRVHGAWVWR